MKVKTWKHPGKEMRKNWDCYVMLFPFATLFTLFYLIPILSSVVLSFTDFDMFQMPSFTGVSNYVRLLFNDEVFIKALRNTIVFAVITGPIGYILSFVLAWLINECGRHLRSLLTLIIYAPALTGNVYFVWQYIFSSDRRGFINNFLLSNDFIREPILWFTDPQYNFGVVALVVIWLSFGAGFLSFVAGLQSLDRTYFEAAAIDGMSNRWQELYYVTFPQMGPQLLFGAVISISGAFAIGYECITLTGNPSTNYSTHTMLIHMLDYGTKRYELGYASAIAVVLFTLMLAAWLLINRLLRKVSV